MPAEKDLNGAIRKLSARWLIGIFLLAITLGILVGAIAAGRLHFPR